MVPTPSGIPAGLRHAPDLGIKKIALDPAESSAIERPENLLGQVGSYEAMWVFIGLGDPTATR